MTKVLFVFLGSSLPKYVSASAKLASKTSGLEVTLLGNARLFRAARREGIDFAPIEDFYDPREFETAGRRISLDTDFRGGFWLKTLERLFVLEQFMSYAKLDSIFHAELDQLLFRTDMLVERLEAGNNQGVFFPLHNAEKGVASVFYCNSKLAFRDLIETAGSGEGFANEMVLLARWARGAGDFFELPTLSDSTRLDGDIQNNKRIGNLGGVVDAAELGLWVGGRDPRNLPVSERPTTKYSYPQGGATLSSGFLGGIRFRYDPDERSLWVRDPDAGGETQVYNLHIHSKVHKWLHSDPGALYRLFEIANSKLKAVLPGTRFTQLTFRGAGRLQRSMKKPSLILTVLAARLNSFLGLRPPSWPFISGDTFRNFADHVWEPGRERLRPEQVKAGSVIFCRTNELTSLNEAVLRHLRKPIVLLLGNSDLPPPSEVFQLSLNPNIRRIFAQNLTNAVSGVEPLPIGIENAWRSNHGRILPFKNARRKSHDRMWQIMWGFNIDTNEEQRMRCANSMVTLTTARRLSKLSPKQHRKALSHFAFCASPPGNGLDTHRTWEAMYLGCVPIVLRSHMTEYYQSAGLPIWLVDDYGDLKSFTEADLEAKYRQFAEGFGSEALWMDFWQGRIQGDLQGL